MAKRNEDAIANPASEKVDEELESLNARVRGRGADSIRRKIEATIENKARKRRRREAPTSSAWKK